jgi:hypothetical protein
MVFGGGWRIAVCRCHEVSLANLAKRDIGQLIAFAKTRLRRMQYQPGLVEGFLTGTRLDLAPLSNLRN